MAHIVSKENSERWFSTSFGIELFREIPNHLRMILGYILPFDS